MTDDDIQKTTIQVSRDTHQQLTELKEWGDSFDDVISRLLNMLVVDPSDDTADEPLADNSEAVDSESHPESPRDEPDSDNDMTGITSVNQNQSSETTQSENSNNADTDSSADQNTNTELDDNQVSITYFDI